MFVEKIGMKGKKKGEVEVEIGEDVSLSTSLGFDHINKVITDLGPIWQKIGMKGAQEERRNGSGHWGGCQSQHFAWI